MDGGTDEWPHGRMAGWPDGWIIKERLGLVKLQLQAQFTITVTVKITSAITSTVTRVQLHVHGTRYEVRGTIYTDKYKDKKGRRKKVFLFY